MLNAHGGTMLRVWFLLVYEYSSSLMYDSFSLRRAVYMSRHDFMTINRCRKPTININNCKSARSRLELMASRLADLSRVSEASQVSPPGQGGGPAQKRNNVARVQQSLLRHVRKHKKSDSRHVGTGTSRKRL